jgi:Carboxypeptidase regulatory-like domain
MKLIMALLGAGLLSLNAQPRSYSGPPRPDQIGTASIAGAVVDALTHQPVNKASVMLSGRIGLNAVTDASGHFAFRQLPAGQYMVQAQSEGYPVGRLGSDLTRQVSITLAADEQKRDVEIYLTPGASLRGRIVDEEGNPMPQCSVAPMQYTDTDRGNTLNNAGGFAQSDDKGEYRITNIPAGKYYVMARCPQTIPLPHAFIRRSSAPDVPMLAYTPLFYPGAADPSGAARVEAQPGATLAAIDFRMTPATGVTVRGRARPFAFDRNFQIMLQPKGPMRRFQQAGARINPSTGEFKIVNVQPGSYELLGVGASEGQSYFARVPIEVGSTSPEPIEVLLSPGPQITGTLAIEGDTKAPVNTMRVMLNPLEDQYLGGPPPQGEVKSDGSFTLSSVVPGRWRVQVNGVPGYVKSVALGEQEVSGSEVEIGISGARMKIVIGTKFAQFEGTVSALPAGAGPMFGFLWAAAGDSSFQQNFGVDPQGHAALSVPPGRYYVCAIAAAQPWMVMQNRALRKAMESRCEAVDISEGGHQKIQISLMSFEELKRMIDNLEQ